MQYKGTLIAVSDMEEIKLDHNAGELYQRAYYKCLYDTKLRR